MPLLIVRVPSVGRCFNSASLVTPATLRINQYSEWYRPTVIHSLFHHILSGLHDSNVRYQNNGFSYKH